MCGLFVRLLCQQHCRFFHSFQDTLELYYKYSPILMEHAPIDTVNAWIKNLALNPKTLIAALLKYQPEKGLSSVREHQGIRYLEYCTKKLGNVDPAVHNFLLSLYVNECDGDDALNAFLMAEVLHRHSISHPPSLSL